jgi:hypothetical protein
MSAGIGRIHGGVVAETLHGGYQMTFLKITGTDIGTADTVGAGGVITEGGFQKAIRALQTLATTVYIGPRADNGFIVAVDSSTAQTTGPAYDTDATPTLAERVKAVLDAATGVTTTVVVPGMLAANVS